MDKLLDFHDLALKCPKVTTTWPSTSVFAADISVHINMKNKEHRLHALRWCGTANRHKTLECIDKNVGSDCALLEEKFGAHERDFEPFNQFGISLTDHPNAFLWAAKYGSVHACCFLKEWNGDKALEKVRANYNLALQWAAKHGQLAVCKLFKQWGLTLNDIQHADYLPFQWAARKGHIDICEFFRDWGLTLNELREYSHLLPWAASGGHVSACEFLKKWGFTVDDVRRHNCMALELAVENNHVEVCRFFRKWGLPSDSWVVRHIFKNAWRRDRCSLICRFLEEWVGYDFSDEEFYDDDCYNFDCRDIFL